MQTEVTQFRRLFQAGDHWLFIVSWQAIASDQGRRFFSEVLDLKPDNPEDLVRILAGSEGGLFIVAAVSKRMLRVEELRRQMYLMDIRMTEEEIRQRDLMIIAQSRALDSATALAGVLFDDPGEPRSLDPPLTIRTRRRPAGRRRKSGVARHCSL
ncbi:MAG: hypothetical protein IPM66_21620 [Acidobacteriota bacterium]|nr:MAG: hypothetical protein IPM66_21620 [Acidobacteriota bacterium]